jgi:hypothetical protein
MAASQKYNTVLANSEVTLSFTVTLLTAGTTSTGGSGTVTIKNPYGTTVLSASIVEEGSGVYTYTVADTVLTTAGLYKVTLAFTASNGKKVTEKFPLLVTEGT